MNCPICQRNMVSVPSSDGTVMILDCGSGHFFSNWLKGELLLYMLYYTTEAAHYKLTTTRYTTKLKVYYGPPASLIAEGDWQEIFLLKYHVTPLANGQFFNPIPRLLNLIAFT